MAYAAVVYVVPLNSKVAQTSHLLIAKIRMAPVKTQTIPRLELCAAVLLLYTLLHRVTIEYGDRVTKVLTWPDSSVVLT